MLYGTLSMGVRRVVPAMWMLAVPLLGGATCRNFVPLQFAPVVHLSLVPPPSQIVPADTKVQVSVTTASAVAVREDRNAFMLNYPFERLVKILPARL